MKNIKNIFFVGLFSITSVYAGSVSIDNKNIENKCVFKFHNQSEKDPASVVLSLPKAGQASVKDIPNENFALVVMECEMSDVPQAHSDENPKTMPHPTYRAYCNSQDKMDLVGSLKTLHVSKDTPVINITVEKPIHGFTNKPMKNNFSCTVDNLDQIN